VARFLTANDSHGCRCTWRAVGLIVALVVCGCGSRDRQSADPDSFKNGEALHRGIGGEPGSLDPGEAADSFSFEVLGDLYEGLTSEAPDGTVIPGVAVSWEVNATGTQYTFNLRHDARWSNGHQVRAEDFVTAWRRVVDPARASPAADNLRPIAGAAAIIAGRASPSTLGVSAPRDNLLIVNLEQPAPYFPQLLTHSAMFPVYSETAATAHNPEKWVSNGAYVLKAWVPGESIRLSRNPYYWDRDSVRIANVQYIPVSDVNAELRQYRAGQLDITESVPYEALASIKKERAGELHVAPFLGTAYYALNLRTERFRTNLDLRKSLAMAIDRKLLESKLLPFGQRPAYGFVPFGTWNYDPQSWSWQNLPDSERIAEARQLYTQAGYSIQQPLHLRLLFNSNAAIKQLAIVIASMWKQNLGIETELVDEEYRVFLQSRKDPSRWDVARLGWTADYNDAGDFLETFRRGSPNNDSGYESQQFDDLLDLAANTANSARRRKLLEAAERLMLSDYPVIPIYFYSSKRLIRSYIKGETISPLDRLYSKHLVIEAH